MARKYMWKLAVFVLAYVAVGCGEAAMQTWITEITNKTPVDYLVYVRCKAARAFSRAASVAEAADWGDPVGYLYPDEWARIPIMLKDAYDLGCQIKMTPVDESSKMPTFYVKGGIPASGRCWMARYDGPYSIYVALRERDLFDSVFKKIKMFRYCGIERTTGSLTIEPDGLTLERESRMVVLDAKDHAHKISLSEFPGVEREQ